MSEQSALLDLAAIRELAEGMHPTHGAVMLEPRQVIALLEEVERLRDGIRRHGDAMQRDLGPGAHAPEDYALWALLDDR